MPDELHAGMERFLPIENRREVCKKEALLNSHSKWLSLTMEDRTDPADWRLRLDLGAIGPWSGCLNSAKIVSYFYDSQESCRVTVLYSCLPQRY